MLAACYLNLTFTNSLINSLKSVTASILALLFSPWSVHYAYDRVFYHYAVICVKRICYPPLQLYSMVKHADLLLWILLTRISHNYVTLSLKIMLTLRFRPECP